MKLKVLNAQTQDEIREIDLADAVAVRGECSFGRSPNSGLVLDSPDVSRLHGKFSLENDRYYFYDLGSANGSLLNGKTALANQGYALNSGDIIRVGEYILMLHDVRMEDLPATVIGDPNATVVGGWPAKMAAAFAEPVAESTPEPIAEPVFEPVAESIAQPVAEPIPELILEPISESIPEPIAEASSDGFGTVPAEIPEHDAELAAPHPIVAPSDRAADAAETGFTAEPVAESVEIADEAQERLPEQSDYLPDQESEYAAIEAIESALPSSGEARETPEEPEAFEAPESIAAVEQPSAADGEPIADATILQAADLDVASFSDATVIQSPDFDRFLSEPAVESTVESTVESDSTIVQPFEPADVSPEAEGAEEYAADLEAVPASFAPDVAAEDTVIQSEIQSDELIGATETIAPDDQTVIQSIDSAAFSAPGAEPEDVYAEATFIQPSDLEAAPEADIYSEPTFIQADTAIESDLVPVEISSESTTDIAVEPVAEPVAEPIEEPIEEPIAEPIDQQVSEPVELSAETDEAAAQPTDNELLDQAVSEPVSEPVSESIAELAGEPSHEPIAEPIAELTDESLEQETAVAEPVSQPPDLEDETSDLWLNEAPVSVESAVPLEAEPAIAIEESEHLPELSSAAETASPTIDEFTGAVVLDDELTGAAIADEQPPVEATESPVVESDIAPPAIEAAEPEADEALPAETAPVDLFADDAGEVEAPVAPEVAELVSRLFDEETVSTPIAEDIAEDIKAEQNVTAPESEAPPVLSAILQEKYIALMAHDSQQWELVQFVERHQELLAHCLTIATPGVSDAIDQQVGLKVSEQTPAVPPGGYQTVNRLLTSGKVLAVIFLRDFLSPQATQANDEALSRSCNIHEVLFASNLPTAEAIIHYIQTVVARQ